MLQDKVTDKHRQRSVAEEEYDIAPSLSLPS